MGNSGKLALALGQRDAGRGGMAFDPGLRSPGSLGQGEWQGDCEVGGSRSGGIVPVARDGKRRELGGTLSLPGIVFEGDGGGSEGTISLRRAVRPDVNRAVLFAIPVQTARLLPVMSED